MTITGENLGTILDERKTSYLRFNEFCTMPFELSFAFGTRKGQTDHTFRGRYSARGRHEYVNTQQRIVF